MRKLHLISMLVGSVAFAGSALAQGGAVGGTAGSAAAGGTAASTVGVGATSTGEAGTSSSIGSAGSAASTDGRATSSTKIHGNEQNLHGMSKAKGQDGGTWSKSMTKTKVKAGESVSSRTKSMAHVPGSKPIKSTTTSSSTIPQ